MDVKELTEFEAGVLAHKEKLGADNFKHKDAVCSLQIEFSAKMLLEQVSWATNTSHLISPGVSWFVVWLRAVMGSSF